MSLSVTEAAILELFADYNVKIWPLQLVMYAFGLGAIVCLGKNNRLRSKILLFILSFMWMWTGVVYHLGFFSRLHSGAVLLGTLFFFEGIIFLSNGMSRKNLILQSVVTVYDMFGWIFILYAMFFYPIIGFFAGHRWPAVSVFGVAPSPVVIFTFGVLLFLKARVSPFVIAIPFLWSLIAGIVAVQLGMYEDIGLLLCGVTGTAMILVRNKRLRDRRNA